MSGCCVQISVQNEQGMVVHVRDITSLHSVHKSRENIAVAWFLWYRVSSCCIKKFAGLGPKPLSSQKPVLSQLNIVHMYTSTLTPKAQPSIEVWKAAHIICSWIFWTCATCNDYVEVQICDNWWYIITAMCLALIWELLQGGRAIIRWGKLVCLCPLFWILQRIRNQVFSLWTKWKTLVCWNFLTSTSAMILM